MNKSLYKAFRRRDFTATCQRKGSFPLMRRALQVMDHTAPVMLCNRQSAVHQKIQALLVCTLTLDAYHV